MSKLIFFDIDGTLAMPGTSPSEETAGAIRAARAAGHKAFICTGRGVELVGDDISSIGFDGGIYHAGGQAILDGKLVYENASDPAMVDELLPVITKYASFYTIETEAGDFNSEFDPEILSRINLDHANTELQRMIHLVLTQRLIGEKKSIRSFSSWSIWRIIWRSKSRSVRIIWPCPFRT